MGIGGCLRRIGDPFGRQQASHASCRNPPSCKNLLWSAGRKQVGDCMRRSGLDLKNAVLRHLAVAGLALLIGSGGVFAQSGTPAPDQPGKPPAASSADATKDNQRKTDEFVEAS